MAVDWMEETRVIFVVFLDLTLSYYVAILLLGKILKEPTQGCWLLRSLIRIPESHDILCTRQGV